MNKEFKAISEYLQSRLGKSTSDFYLRDVHVGVANWSSVNLNTQIEAMNIGAAVFDASAMSYIRIKGHDAKNVLDYLTPRDIGKLRVNSANFIIFTTPEGTVDDECIALKINNNEFLLSCGSCKMPTYMKDAVSNFPDVDITFSPLISFNIKGKNRIDAAQEIINNKVQNTISINSINELEYEKVFFKDNSNGFVVRTKIGIEFLSDLKNTIDMWEFMLNNRDIYTPAGWDALNIYRKK